MKSIIFYLFLILFVSMANTSSAQNQPTPCTAPECTQFDFWLGDWELTYNNTKGTNTVTREMGGCLIHEHFNDPKNAYMGESWSVYNPKTKKWQQTWVDNQGAYIVLTGEFQDGKMTLFNMPVVNNDIKTQNRMVFYNITADSFDWDWETTTDDGKTWKNNWHIHYQRKK